MKTIIIDGVEYNLTPKIMFKNGTWLVENEPNNYARFIQILEVVDVQGKERYRISRDLHNDEDVVEYRFIENNYHSFNIKDAKDGDVLSYRDGQWIFIYKGIVTEDTFKYYALLSEKGITLNDAAFSLLPSCITPATKEQRNQLEKAMTDAGYKWNKKERKLEKIEQNPWSEEDEEHIKSVLKRLDGMCKKDATFTQTCFAVNQDMDWLKSLRPQTTWKPSDKQMEVLWKYAEQNNYDGMLLTSLYNDLKKLKG